MCIGHFGAALAAKKLAPQASLGALILAAQFLDFLWPLFLLLGIEHVRIVPGITRTSPLDFVGCASGRIAICSSTGPTDFLGDWCCGA